jgi:molybdopterin synthase sulfur carrier subunit
MASSNAMATVTVRLPSVLRARVGYRASVSVVGSTVRDVIAALEEVGPGLRFNLCHETGELRPYVNIFLDAVNIRYLDGLDTAVPPGATLYVLQSVAGG